MTDLIWIGNTLLPRWVVFAIVLVGLLALLALTSYLADKTK